MPPETTTSTRGISWALSQLRTGIYWLLRRIDNLLSQMRKGPSEGWVTFILLLLSVMAAIWSMGRAHWAPTPGLYLLALWGVVLGLLLAKMRFRGWLLAINGLLVGICLSLCHLASLVEGPTSLDRFADVGSRLFTWGRAFASGEVSSDPLLVIFLFLVMSWLVGFISAWSLFRKHNIWGAVLPSGIMIVANAAILPSGAHKFPLYLYLFIVCLLMARLFVLEREHDWNQRSVQRRHLDSVLLPKAFGFALAIVIATSLLPTPSAKLAPVAAVWDRVTSPVRAISEEFAGVAPKVPAEDPVFDHSFGHTNPFRPRTILEEEPVLMVQAPSPVYLRARSYDVYTHKGWETGDTQMVSPELSAEKDLEEEFPKSRQAGVTVKVLFSLRAGEPVYLAGYPVDVSIGYRLEVLQPASYQISIPESEAELAVEAESLPLELREAIGQIWEMSIASPDKLTESDIRSALPEDVRVISFKSGREGIEQVTVERHIPSTPDAVSVRTTRPVSAGDSYQATVRVPTATRSDLLAAGSGYPGWILDRYLQLPDTMPSRVADLAQELTKDIETPYEKAVAICDYLRTLEYTLDLETLPDRTDGVDYFLFQARKGYCQYFASAMTVLLRASGVPSRMVVGYYPFEPMDQYDPGNTMEDSGRAGQGFQTTFVARNSHSWSEVFFPGYGWMPFEPTPAYPPIARGEAVLPPQDGEPTDDSAVDPNGIETGIPWNIRLLGVSVGLAFLAGIMWLGWRRLLGQVSEPQVAYARISHLAALGGMAPRENLTPQEYGRKLAATVPEMAAALNQIVHAYVRESYSSHSLNSEDRSNVAKAWPQVRNHLLRHVLHSTLPFGFGRKRSRS
jgi:transglutaminase-like putative cysteine protease